jgi:hypothetical protein
MFISCPHCRELVVTDRETRLPPPMCPRCGGELREKTDDDAVAQERTVPQDDAPARTPSIATFLQAGDRAAAEPAADISGTEATADVALDAEADSTTASEVAVTTDASADTGHAPVHAISGEQGNGDPVDEDAGTVREETPAPAPLVNDADVAVIEFAEAGTDAAAATAARMAEADAAPSFTRQAATSMTPARTAKWQWAVLALLSVLLLVQVLVADRARLAADEHWRPLITRLCGALRCDVPPWHQPGAFAMLSRDVRPISGTPGGLHVQATFRNDAAWAQDWPLLQLSLSDADGRVVGTRAFTPAEYLGKAATPAGLAPGQSAQVALQLHEPNPGVVAFSFDFR